jgi:hypothetical protein
MTIHQQQFLEWRCDSCLLPKGYCRCSIVQNSGLKWFKTANSKVAHFLEGSEVMQTSLKIGSVIRIPLYSSWTAVSSDPSTVGVSVVGGIATVTALKAGSVWITLTVAADVKAMLKTDVTAN